MHFEKISYGQWKNDIPFTEIDDLVIRRWYGNIKLPQQGTAHSMGVDFCVPYNIRILAHNKIKIPTGIRWVCDTEEEKTYGLLLVPRSSTGIKCGLRLLNTVGVVDADYADAELYDMNQLLDNNSSLPKIDFEKMLAYNDKIKFRKFKY